MRHLPLFTLLTIICCLTNNVHAQDDTIPVPNMQRLIVPSEILKEERTIWISTPSGYNESSETYPVLYLLDGDGHFKYVSEMVEYLSGRERMRIPQMIVVAILNTDRNRDFTPVHSLIFNGKTDSSLVTTGGGKTFLKFIGNELIPFIDKNYRTQPYRILEGHSLGGLFAVYSMEAAKELFQSRIIISPAFYGGNNKILTDFGSFLRNNKQISGKMFVSIGDEPKQKVDSLIHQLKTAAPGSLKWTYKIYQDENHFSVPYKSMYDGLRFVYPNWYVDLDKEQLSDYGDIKKHFNKLSAEFGYTINPTEEFVNQCGYRQLRSGHIDNAISIFKENVKNHPNSFNVYDSMAEAYMKKGEKKLAISNYEKSISLNPKNEDGRSMLKELKNE